MILELLTIALMFLAWAAMQAGLELWNGGKRFKAAVCYIAAALFLWLGLPKPVIVELTAPVPAPQKYRL